MEKFEDSETLTQISIAIFSLTLIIISSLFNPNLKAQIVKAGSIETHVESDKDFEYEFENEIKDGKYEFNLQQIQKAGSNAVQVQRGRENRKSAGCSGGEKAGCYA